MDWFVKVDKFIPLPEKKVAPIIYSSSKCPALKGAVCGFSANKELECNYHNCPRKLKETQIGQCSECGKIASVISLHAEYHLYLCKKCAIARAESRIENQRQWIKRLQEMDWDEIK